MKREALTDGGEERREKRKERRRNAESNDETDGSGTRQDKLFIFYFLF